LKWTVTAEGEKSSSELKGHISVPKNPDLMYFGVNAFASDWFTIYVM
jgi:hypothetical protein